RSGTAACTRASPTRTRKAAPPPAPIRAGCPHAQTGAPPTATTDTHPFAAQCAAPRREAADLPRTRPAPTQQPPPHAEPSAHAEPNRCQPHRRAAPTRTRTQPHHPRPTSETACGERVPAAATRDPNHTPPFAYR